MSISLQLNPALVTMPEKDKISLQTDTSFFADEKRIITYCEPLKLKEKTKIIVELGEHIIINTAKGAAKGALAGALVGGPFLGVVGLMFAGVPGFVGGYKLGTGLTAFAEGVEGARKGLKEFEIEFMSSDKYKVWAEEARKTDVYPVYKKIVEGDPRFDTYICPLSMDLICIPVRAPDGRIYEQENITQWITIKENQIKQIRESGGEEEQINAKINSIRETLSPMRIKVESFTVGDLRYFPEYFKRLDSVAKRKISEMENTATKEAFETAMKAIQAAQRENQKQIIKLQMAEITMYVLNNELDPKISTNACQKLNEEIKKIEKEEKEFLEKEKKL